MYNIKKVIIICLIALLVVIPTAYASDNQIDLGLNIDDTLSDSYYFDANADSSGNGSIDSPYNNLRYNIKDNSVIYLDEGTYNGYAITADNLTIIGKSSENTIIKNMNIDVDGSLVIYDVTFITSRITNGGSVTLVNSIFKNSAATTGGVLTSTSHSYLNITNCSFENNHANGYAGVIYATESTIDISNSNFDKNYANNYAGVIYCDKNSKLTVSNTNFTNNQAKNDAGGAIYIRDSVMVASYVNISNSSATFGGAITALNSDLYLSNLNVRDNKAKYRGGSIYSVYGDYVLVNSIFENNTASDGGALFIDSPYSLEVSSDSFTNNSALSVGGAVYIISDETYSISNISFLNNSAGFNSDIYETILPNLTIGGGDYILIYYNESYDEELPESYDLRNLNEVTSVKNQGKGGNCWAFATIASLESCILKATGTAYDLSEENMKNLMALYSDYGWNITPNVGGYIAMGIGYLTSWLGPINDTDDVYYGSSVLSPVLDSFIHVQNILFLNRANYTDNDAIKRAIIEHGAVSTSIYWSSSYANGKNYYNYEHDSGANHAVVIVGWDDNYSKSNFNKTAPGDGAWIIKNSWGTNTGEDGYYYVSYYDVRLAPLNNPSAVYTFVFADSIKYDKNYQYDIQGMTDYFLNSSSSVWYKNKFIATDDEYLAAVSTYFQKETLWELSIYVNDELKLTQSGSAVSSYSTIELNQFISLKKGDTFEIVFKITVDGDAGVPISEMISFNNMFYSENISYISYDGKIWNDLFNISWKYPNHTYNSQVACIKAFTVFDKVNSTIALIVIDENNPVEIIATVSNQYGNLINSGKVTFNIGGKEYIVDVKNGIAKMNYTFENSENKLVTASFSNEGYIGSYSNMTIYSKQILLNANDLVTYSNKTFTYSVTVVDNSSKPVVNKEITFKINNKKYVVLTDSNGIAKIDLNLNLGSYDIEIGFNNFLNYEMKLTKKITVKSSIEMPVTAVYVYNSKYAVNLVDENGKRLSNCQIEIIVNGITDYVYTDDNGVIKYNIDLKPGSYSINVINPKTGGISIQNIKVVSRITGNKDITKYYNAVNYYKVKVVDDNGNVKKNLKVTIKLNGKTYYKYTDSNGYVSLKISSSVKPGTYAITATYNGFKVSNKIIVKHNIITKNIAIQKGKTGKFTAKIVDSKGKILKYKTVTFKFRGKTYKVKTNKYGIATLKIAKKSKITKYSITTSYGIETVKNTITIKR